MAVLSVYYSPEYSYFPDKFDSYLDKIGDSIMAIHTIKFLKTLPTNWQFFRDNFPVLCRIYFSGTKFFRCWFLLRDRFSSTGKSGFYGFLHVLLMKTNDMKWRFLCEKNTFLGPYLWQKFALVSFLFYSVPENRYPIFLFQLPKLPILSSFFVVTWTLAQLADSHLIIVFCVPVPVTRHDRQNQWT